MCSYIFRMQGVKACIPLSQKTHSDSPSIAIFSSTFGTRQGRKCISWTANHLFSGEKQAWSAQKPTHRSTTSENATVYLRLSSCFSPQTLHRYLTHVVMSSSVSVARKYVRFLCRWKVLIDSRFLNCSEARDSMICSHCSRSIWPLRRRHDSSV